MRETASHVSRSLANWATQLSGKHQTSVWKSSVCAVSRAVKLESISICSGYILEEDPVVSESKGAHAMLTARGDPEQRDIMRQEHDGFSASNVRSTRRVSERNLSSVIQKSNLLCLRLAAWTQPITRCACHNRADDGPKKANIAANANHCTCAVIHPALVLLQGPKI